MNIEIVWGTYIDDTSSMAGEKEFAVQPLIPDPLVEGAGADNIIWIVRVTYFLVQQQVPIEGEQQQSRPAA